MPILHKATGTTGAVALTVTPDWAFELMEVRVHLNGAGGAGDLTVKQDAIAGAAYDTVLLTQDMTAVTDLVYIPSNPMQFSRGDKIVVAWANAGNKTYGVEVYVRQVH
jgi:hypothetical protein